MRGRQFASQCNHVFATVSEGYSETHTHAERAVKEAENDHKDQIQWADEEDRGMKEEILKEIQENVDETINDEKSELEMIRSQCNEDIKTIGVSLYIVKNI